MTETFYLGTTIFSIAFGYTWKRYLTSPGEIFDFIPVILNRIIIGTNCSDGIPEWKVKILKVLYDCEKCVAGQAALWIGLIIPFIDGTYSIIAHFFSIVVTIFLTGLIVEYGKR